ncbi:MAG: alpha/beta hydrolase, partial [Actinomycetota bacterium]|nr:alpha/beta hydrolase [Actinomycetota bacterium]
MADIHTEHVEVNRVSLEVTHAGSGPMVLLLHGFPELAHSWRHQVSVLADAGYHAVAPNQRGYGGSSQPDDIGAYNIFELVGDAVALAAHYGDSSPVVVGHDWGSMVAWHCALLRPDLFRGVVGMSVPYLPRGDMGILDMITAVANGGFHYILHFQEPGVAEAELDADPEATMRQMMWSVSGDRPDTMVVPDPVTQTSLFEAAGVPDGLPGWISEAELAVYTEAFGRSGFRGGINWYRNFAFNHRHTAPWHQARIAIPAAFVGGLADFVVNGGTPGEVGPGVGLMEAMCDDFRGSSLLEGIGHWNQQEAPEA